MMPAGDSVGLATDVYLPDGEPTPDGPLPTILIHTPYGKSGLAATANRFAASHRIRVDIASSNFPMYDVNPNTGKPLGRHTRLQVARNTIYVGPQQRSALVVSITPRRP